MAEAGVVWVPVVPSMRGFAGTLTRGVTRDAAKAGTLAGTTMGASMKKAFAAAGGGIAGTLKAASVGATQLGGTLTKNVTVPLAAVGVAAVKVSMDFEKSMNNLQAISGASAKQLKTLRDQAIDLGNRTKFSAQEAADGMANLAQAGFNTTQIYKAMPDVLNLAAAGNIEVAQASEIATSVLRGYGLQVNDLAHVNDVLAKAAIATNAELADTGEAFKYVAPIAKSAGVGFEEATAALGILSDAGIKGSMAGTSLRGIISALLNPTSKAADVLNDLGVKATTSDGKLRPLNEIVKQLKDSGATTGDMMTVFGQRAGPGMAALVSRGDGAMRKLTKQLKNSGGTADQVAKTQMKGLAGQLDNLQSAAESLMIAIGDAGVLDGLTKLTRSLTGLVTKASETNPRLLRFGVYAAGAAAALGPLLWTGGKTIGMLTSLATGLWRAGSATVTAGRATVQAVQGFRNMNLAYKSGATWATTFGAATRAAANSVGRFIRQVALSTVTLARNAVAKAANVVRTVAMTVAERAAAAASRIWAGVQWLLNAAMSANPIGIVIAIVVALVAAIVIAYRKSSTFRSIVQAAFRGIAAVAQWVWKNVLQPVFKALGIVVKVVAVLVRVYFGLIQIYFKILGRIAMWLYRNAVLPAFRGIGAIVRWAHRNVVKPTMNAITAALRFVGRIFTWLWRNAVVPAWRGIGLIIRVQAAIIRGIFSTVRSALRVLGDAALWVYRKAIAPAFRGIRTVISTVWNSGVRPVLSAMSNFIRKTVPNAFRAGVDAIRAAWRKVQAAAKAPVSFVLRTVIKKGIVGSFNKIAGMFGVKKIDFEVPQGFAAGTRNLTKAATAGWRNKPTAIVGEGSRRHPESVIPTDPKYRQRAVALWRETGAELGMPMMASGGRLVAFGKWLQRQGFRVGEHPAFGGVAPVHTSGSWHYRRGAIDVNYGPGGSSRQERRAFNRLIKSGVARKQYGLRSIWAYPGHHDHAHFDIGSGPDLGMKQGGGKGLLGLLGGVFGRLTNPFKGLLDKVKDKMGEFGRWGGLLTGSMRKLISGAWEWVKAHNPFAGVGEGEGDVGGARRWAPLVRRVLKELGEPASALRAVLHRINQESGGNPRAVNNWDINAKRGTPSKGLMQTIGPTFNAYAGKYRRLGIFNPLANIYAGINYARNRYGGGWIRKMTAPGGYDNGGWLMPGATLAYNATRKPEAVLTDKQWRTLRDGGRTSTSVNVSMPASASPGDVAHEVLFALRHMDRGGVYTGASA